VRQRTLLDPEPSSAFPRPRVNHSRDSLSRLAVDHRRAECFRALAVPSALSASVFCPGRMIDPEPEVDERPRTPKHPEAVRASRTPHPAFLYRCSGVPFGESVGVSSGF